MRWSVKKEPKQGDLRVQRLFAWRPQLIADKVIWLERYEVHYRFFQPKSGNPGWWSETGRYYLSPVY